MTVQRIPFDWSDVIEVQILLVGYLRQMSSAHFIKMVAPFHGFLRIGGFEFVHIACGDRKRVPNIDLLRNSEFGKINVYSLIFHCWPLAASVSWNVSRWPGESSIRTIHPRIWVILDGLLRNWNIKLNIIWIQFKMDLHFDNLLENGLHPRP